MSALELEVYEIFKNRFTEKEAAKVIEYFELKTEEKIVQKKDIFMTKDDKLELVSRIETSKTDTIKWMFIFWIGQLAAVAGILFALANVYFKR
ncbi:MAG: hypothetical protein M3015_02010 [Bacteroidota bacterium]|nr:hypothetical protein [Bacteroidota bacterium]